MSEMQGKSLGMAVGIFDEDGKDISKTGVPGDITRRYSCSSGATMRVGVSSSRRTMTPARAYGATATSSL